MFNIIYGQAHSALLKSVPVATGQVLEEGEWVVFSNDGTVSKQAGVYDGAKRAYPVIGGNKVRFDSKQLGRVTICLGTSFYAESDKIQSVTINAGARLTLKDGLLTVAAADAVATLIVADCTVPNVNGRIEFSKR